MKKRILALFTAAVITLCSLPSFCFVSAVDGDNSGTGADGGYANISGSTWNEWQQGYRFCIVDENGAAVSNAVDILFTPRPSNSVFGLSSRTGGTATKYILWSDLGITPPFAVAWNGGPIGNGENFKNWFASGNNAKIILKRQIGTSYIFTFSKADDKALVASGKSPYDVCNSQDYYITIEPLTWFVPCNWNTETKTMGNIHYDKYIYGTIYNICGWYKNTSGASKYGISGGGYSNVLGVMWQSMYTIGGLGSAIDGVSQSEVIAYSNTTNNLGVVYDKLSSGFGAGMHVYYLGGSSGGDGGAGSGGSSNPVPGGIGLGSYSYPTSTTVITSVTLMNTGTSEEQDIGIYNPATVTFKVNNQTYTVPNVYIPHGGTQLVWIKWKTPSTAQNLNMSITTTQGAFSTSSGAVGSMSLSITIYSYGSENTPPDPVADDTAKMFAYNTSSSTSYLNSLSTVTSSTSWYVWNCKYLYTKTVTGPDMPDETVSASELNSKLDELKAAGYVIKNYYEKTTSAPRSFTHTCTEKENVLEVCTALAKSGATDITYSGKVIKYTKVVSVGTGYYVIQYKEADYGVIVYQYDKINYTAAIQAPSITIKPSDNCPTWYKSGSNTYMKSGYGIYTTAAASIKLTVNNTATNNVSTSTVSTGSTGNSAAVGFQWAYAYFPEFTYQTYNRLLEVENNNTFGFRWNKYSAINGGDDAHYTPIWYPDSTDYRIYVRMNFAYTPNGALSIGGQSDSIRISGNVYDDWHVAIVH